MPPSYPTNGPGSWGECRFMGPWEYSSGGVRDRARGEAVPGTWMAPAAFMIDGGGGSLLPPFHHTHLCLPGHPQPHKGRGAADLIPLGPGSLCYQAGAHRAFLSHFLPLPRGGQTQAGPAGAEGRDWTSCCIRNPMPRRCWEGGAGGRPGPDTVRLVGLEDTAGCQVRLCHSAATLPRSRDLGYL